MREELHLRLADSQLNRVPFTFDRVAAGQTHAHGDPTTAVLSLCRPDLAALGRGGGGMVVGGESFRTCSESALAEVASCMVWQIVVSPVDGPR